MSGAKFTYGQWLTDDKDPQFVYSFGPACCYRFWLRVASVHTATDELIAIARLIAAAPELLEALEGAYALAIGHAAAYQCQHRLGEPHPTHQAILDKARAAIAKAEGA